MRTIKCFGIFGRGLREGGVVFDVVGGGGDGMLPLFVCLFCEMRAERARDFLGEN